MVELLRLWKSDLLFNPMLSLCQQVGPLSLPQPCLLRASAQAVPWAQLSLTPQLPFAQLTSTLS